MHPDERGVPRLPHETEAERPVRVLDGGRFTFAAPAEVRRPRFLDAEPAGPRWASRRAVAALTSR